MCKIFIITIFIFLFSTFTNAQEIPPSYGFVEVIDSNNKSVADASVCRGDCDKVSANQAYLIEKTNQQGLMEKGIRLYYGDVYKTPFSIYKEGFYPFFDCYGLFKFLGYGWRNNKDKPLKIELLKIPKSKGEKKIIGNEQLKREFFWAIYNNDTETLRRLLKLKISPNLKTGDLRGIPISESVSAPEFAAKLLNNEALAELISAGADINSKESPAKNVLVSYLLAIPQPDPGRQSSEYKEEQKQLMLNSLKEVELLLNAGADIHFVSSQGETALTIAMSRGFAEIFKKLLTLDFSQDEKNETLEKLILYLDDKKPQSLELAELLIKSGADPRYSFDEYSAKKSGCSSLLMLAAAKNKLNFAKLLLEKGANINFQCKNGETALISALGNRDIEMVKLLFNSGISVYGKSNWGATPLILAADRGDIESVKFLLGKGFPINEKYWFGDTPLTKAAENLNFAMVELLLKSGADPNITGGNNLSALWRPAEKGNLQIIRLLIANKADVNLSSPIFATTYDYGQPEALKLLLEAGADAKGEQGKKTLQAAKETLKFINERLNNPELKSKFEEIIKLLEAAGAKE